VNTSIFYLSIFLIGITFLGILPYSDAELIASTFFGSTSTGPVFVDVDASGNVYSLSKIHKDGWATTGAYSTSMTGNSDFIIAKFSPDLSTLIASTYLSDGDISDNWQVDLMIDDSGDVIVLANANPQDITLSLKQHDSNDATAIFIAKFSPDLSTLKGSAVIGGSSSDSSTSLEIDQQGNIIVAGLTQSSDFPTTPNAYDTTHAGSYEAVLAKFSPDLSTLIASTFLGGTDYDRASDLAISSEGNIVLVGQSRSTDFPTTSNAYDTTFNGGGSDLIISSFSPDLSTLIASTWLGASENDYGGAIAIDSVGNIIIVGGTSNSAGLPTTQNAYQSVAPTTNPSIIAKFSPDLSTLIASTFLGGTEYTRFNSILLDDENNIYLAGSVEDGNFPVTADAYQPTFMPVGQFDGAISHLSSDLSTLIASTLIGGSSTERIEGIAFDTLGNIVVSTLTPSNDYPSTTGAYQTTMIEGTNQAITKFSPDLSFTGSTNHVPTIISQDDFTDEDTSNTFSLVGNDRDGDQLTFSIIDQPSNGQISGTSPNFTYVPNSNFNGYDSFTFQANDGTSDSKIQSFSIQINSIEDAPTVNDNSINVVEDTPTTIPLSGLDDDGDTLSFTVIESTANGNLLWTGTDFIYTPYAQYNGQDSFTFKAVEVNSPRLESNIGTISISINAVNDVPVAGNAIQSTSVEDSPVSITLIGTDADNDPLNFLVITNPAHGELFGTAPNLNYSPDPDFNGQDSFTFKINDGTIDSEIETVNLTITSINDIPVANAGSDQSVSPSISVTLDGSQSLDVDDDSITYHWVQTSGTPVTLSDDTVANPQLSTPSTEDTLSFMLTVSDGTATSNPDVVNIYIGSPVPDPIPPPPPTSLSTTSLDGSVKISWQPPTDNGGETITDYIIEFKKESDTTWQIHDDSTTSTPTTTISGLINDENYQFRISSVSLAGVGDTSSLISEIPVGFVTETVEPTVETTPEPTVETTPEPTVETTPEPTSKEILSFVDATKDPKTYIERYVQEPSYKEWFDSNYPDYTIYEGVGITEDEYLIFVGSLDEPVVTKSQEIIADPEPTSDIKDQEPTCGAGTIAKDGICIVDTMAPEPTSDIKDQEPTCGAGTIAKDGICIVDTSKSESSSKGGGCLIATATYGSELAPQVQQLRELRDNQLLSTESGTNFMNTFNDVYYSFSPIIADYERENPVFKEMVKVTITPMITSLSLMEYAETETAVLGIGISIILLNIGMYFVTPAIIIVGIRKSRN
jgi:hypothetical protein